INRFLGVAFMLVVVVMLGFIAFQIIYWIGGNTVTEVTDALNGSLFKLDWLYENNPLRAFAEIFVTK
ncbi:MAG: hypothetical protein ACI4L9_06190, partial [Candidatus Coproplasma sp.]